MRGSAPVGASGTGRQLTLDLGHTPSYDAADFLVSPSNAEAHEMIVRWPDWPDPTLLLVGPPGSGKSHLAAVWAQRAAARRLRPGDAIDPRAWPAAALIEDADRAGYAEAELFHVLNIARESRAALFVTARVAPAAWGLWTPDLVSRLRLAPMMRIGRPDEPLIRAVIVKLFADRQIRIDADVVAFAARHCDQSLEAVARFVAAVDAESLAAGRRITRPLAAQSIASLAKEAPALD